MIAVSTAATVARMAQEEGLPSLLLAGGRLLIATLVLSPLVLIRHLKEFKNLKTRDWILLITSGMTLGLHFATWIQSLEWTTLISSVFFFSTSPIFMIFLSYPILGERVTRPVVLGTLVAFVGGLFMIFSPGREHEDPQSNLPLLGDALALLSALAFALYLILGRKLQGKLKVIPYIWSIYLVAGLSVFVPSYLLTDMKLTGHSTMGYIWLIYLGLVPQLIGHSSFNYALQHMQAIYVGLISRLEAIGSTIMGTIILKEIPHPYAIVGALFLFCGVFYANWWNAKQQRKKAREISSAKR